jgi:hypothetical protein
MINLRKLKMSKHTFTISLTVCGIEVEHDAEAEYDYSNEDGTAVVYDVYIVKNKDTPYLYMEEYLTDNQFDAIEDEIVRSRCE